MCVDGHIIRTLQLGLNYVYWISGEMILGGGNCMDYYEKLFKYV